MAFYSWLERSSNANLSLTTTLALGWSANECIYVFSLNHKLKLVIDSVVLQAFRNGRNQLDFTFVDKRSDICFDDAGDSGI